MPKLKFFKVTTLPVTLEADAFYYVQNGQFAEAWITDSNAEKKAVGNTDMINAVVAEQLEDAIANQNLDGGIIN